MCAFRHLILIHLLAITHFHVLAMIEVRIHSGSSQCFKTIRHGCQLEHSISEIGSSDLRVENIESMIWEKV